MDTERSYIVHGRLFEMVNRVLVITTQVIVMAIVISLILIFMGIGMLVLIHVCIVGRTLRRGFIDSDVNMVERGSLGSTSMSQDDIEKLPCFNFMVKDKGNSSPADCAVCLENFKVGEKCRLLPLCNHSFHAECVDLWLLRTPVCPICRTGADLMKGGSLFGEQRDSFSGSGAEVGDRLIIETVPGNDIGIQTSGIGTGESSSSNRISGEVEVRETSEIVEREELSREPHNDNRQFK